MGVNGFLAMYDIRSIQGYIFKTNKVAEIIGASKIVDSIFVNAFNSYVKENNKKTEEYIIDWEKNNENDYLGNKKIKMEVIFIGGGNAYVLYRSKAICENVNNYLQYYVLKNSYSLKVAIAKVELDDSNDFETDYANLISNISVTKNKMVEALPVGAFPFAKVDSRTGFPITVGDGDKVCTETRLKLNTYNNINELKKLFGQLKDCKCLDEKTISIIERIKEISRKFNESDLPISGIERLNNKDFLNAEIIEQAIKKIEKDEKVFDDIVEKGENSTLALICIDGNNMGERIIEKIKGTEYSEAIKNIRSVSKGVDGTFKNAYESMEKYINTDGDSIKKKYRRIVLAGDDICFVCNHKDAIGAVKHFFKTLNDSNISYMGKNEKPFSACAGIAFFNSHFPFSDAYKVAEACCENAKEKAKENKRKDDKQIGNFIDFQICTNVNASNLDTYRDKHYTINGDSFINRPYFVMTDKNETLNNNNKDCDIRKLEEKITTLNSISRNIAKEIREVIVQGDNEIEKEIYYLNSRGIYLNNDLKNNNTLREEKSIWYDACELMDIWKLEGGKTHEKK